MVALRSRILKTLSLALLCAAFPCFTGCKSTGEYRSMTAEDMVPIRLVLTEGDVLDIKFPGAPNLSSSYRIGPEGFLSMPLIGQVQASGKTALELQEYLVKMYENQLQDKEILVTLTSSANVVYVTGAVSSPGPLPLIRPTTVLEAILQAGGFHAGAGNLKKVVLIRYEDDKNVIYELNLDPLFTGGGPVIPFYLRPRDIIVVPAKVQWF